MQCSKRAIVFIRSGNQPPAGTFLGFQKIVPSGAYAYYCVDGLTIDQYPEGWLSVIDEQGNEIEKNATAQQAQPGTGVSLGFNPWGILDSPLPAWLWMFIIGAIIIYLKEKK